MGRHGRLGKETAATERPHNLALLVFGIIRQRCKTGTTLGGQFGMTERSGSHHDAASILQRVGGGGSSSGTATTTVTSSRGTAALARHRTGNFGRGHDFFGVAQGASATLMTVAGFGRSSVDALGQPARRFLGGRSGRRKVGIIFVVVGQSRVRVRMPGAVHDDG